MDSYIRALIKTSVRIDAGNRVFLKDQPIEVHMIGGVRKVVLPGSKITYTFEDLKRAGARCETQTLKTLAKAGAEGRWRENIEERRKVGLPSNVYIANARSIEYAISKGRTPPDVKFVGRIRNQITEVFDTVDEVISAMGKGDWRKTFSKGRNAKRKTG